MCAVLVGLGGEQTWSPPPMSPTNGPAHVRSKEDPACVHMGKRGKGDGGGVDGGGVDGGGVDGGAPAIPAREASLEAFGPRAKSMRTYSKEAGYK